MLCTCQSESWGWGAPQVTLRILTWVDMIYKGT